MKLEDFLYKEEGDDSRHLPDGRVAATWDNLGKCWNIGPGLTHGVTRSTVWTAEQLQAAEDAEFRATKEGVAKLVKVPLGENRMTVLQSFAYNCGLGALANSSILRSVNAGRFDEVPAELRLYVHARGARGPVPGLVRRRADEIRLWQHPDDAPAPADLRTPQAAPPAIHAIQALYATDGGFMNTLLMKLFGRWALERLGEGSTYAGLWLTLSTSYGIYLNPHVQANLTNVFVLLFGAILIGMKEGFTKRAA